MITHPFWGWFVICMPALAMVNLYTKFKVLTPPIMKIGKATQKVDKKAVLSQGTTARCRALVQKASAMQWIERTPKLSANIGECRKTTSQVYRWRTDACRRMASRNPRTKVHKIWGISFNWPDPQRCQISSCPDKNCARYLLWKNFALGKIDQVHPRSPVCHQSIW